MSSRPYRVYLKDGHDCFIFIYYLPVYKCFFLFVCLFLFLFLFFHFSAFVVSNITFTNVLLDHTVTVCCFGLLGPNCLWCWFAVILVFGLFLIIFVCLFVLCFFFFSI